MTYYDDEQNVRSYIDMAEGYDGRELIDVLGRYLPAGSTVLELGMGPGKDLALLAEQYSVTGSDASAVFVDLVRTAWPQADLLQLDAVTLETERTFDGIYSNKVLYHLTQAELAQSFERQAVLLKPGGIALHSFWFGEGEENRHGLRFVYYTVEQLTALVPASFEILETSLYREMDDDDSICLVLRRKG